MTKKSTLQSLSPWALIPCLLSIASTASAEVRCSPVASPQTVRPGGQVSLNGNCRDYSDANPEGLPLSQSNEMWFVQTSEGGVSVGQRSLPDGTLTVTAPTIPGEQQYYIQSIDGYGGPINFGGEGGYPTVTVTVDAAATSTPTIDQLSTALTTLQTSRVRSQLNQAQSHLRSLRSRPASSDKLEVYVGGSGDSLKQDASETRSEFKARTTSLSVGADYRLSDDWAMGANVGASRSHVVFDGSSSDQKSTGRQVTAYASWSVSQATYLTATLSYEASRFDLLRDDGSGQVSTSSPRGHGLGISLSAGRDFAMGPWTIGPYVRWDGINSDIDAFTESGSDAALAIGAQSTRSTTFNVGTQTQVSVPVSWGILLPYVRLELSRRSDSTRQAATATLLSDNTALLVPNTVDIRGNYGSVALGVSGVNQGGVSWFADFESGLAQKGYRSQRFGLGLRFEL